MQQKLLPKIAEAAGAAKTTEATGELRRNKIAEKIVKSILMPEANSRKVENGMPLNI